MEGRVLIKTLAEPSEHTTNPSTTMHKLLLAHVLIVLGLFACGGPGGPNGGAGGGPGTDGGTASAAEQNALDAAKADFDARRYSAALAEFQAFLGTYPHSSLADQATLYVGRCKYEAAPPDYAGAIAVWKSMLTSFPQSAALPEARYWIGRAYFQSKDFATARVELQAQLSTSPNNAFADVVGVYLARCDFETASGANPAGFASAQAALTQLLSQFPTSGWRADMLYWRGRCQWEQKAFAAAKADFDQITSQFRTSALADNASYWADRCLFSQASLATPTVTWAAAAAAFAATEASFPASNVRDLVANYLGRSQFQNLDYPTARATFDRQLTVWPTLPSSWSGHYWRGRTLLMLATPDRTGAIADFQAVIDTGTTSSWYDNAFQWKAKTQADLALCADAATTYAAMKSAVPSSPVRASTCTYVLAKCPAQVCP